MLVFIIGGSGSGKSEYAERRCTEFGITPLTYLATMETASEESKSRIARHRKLRDGKGFCTLECLTHLEQIELPSGGVVLLEGLSNLIANEMFSSKGRLHFDAEEKQPVSDRAAPDLTEQAVNLILCGIQHIVDVSAHTVIVSDQIFSDGIQYGAETEYYRQILAGIHQRIFEMADEAVEVVHGIPLQIKSREITVDRGGQLL